MTTSKKQTAIVEYWKITVYNQHAHRYEDIKVYGYEVSTVSEAKKTAKEYGKVINVLTIYAND